MIFVDAVNRVLVIEGVLGGDDDDITSFSSTQHASTIRTAKVAIQHELTYLTSHKFIPYERDQAVLSVLTGQRLWAPESDFVQFDGIPRLQQLDVSLVPIGSWVSLYPGGEQQIQSDYHRYQEDLGNPIWFYETNSMDTHRFGLYPLPSENRSYRYYFQKDVSVTNETDILPFFTEPQAQAFTMVAAERFKFLRLNQEERVRQYGSTPIDDSPVIEAHRAHLLRRIGIKDPPKGYGRRYA